MNTIWTYMMLISTAVLLIVNPQTSLTTMLDASKSGLMLCLDLCTIYAVWLGFMEILDKSGLSDKLAKLISPIIEKLFKTKNKTAQKYIAINLSSNILGLGNAATPSGIMATHELDDHTGKANFPIIMLIVVNTTSLQLLPTTVMGLRSNFGSISPGDIIIPTLITTTFTTVVGILLVLLINKCKKKVRKS